MKKQGLAPNLNASSTTGDEHSSSAPEDERQDSTIGGRLRMIRRGILGLPVVALSNRVERSAATIKRYEANAPVAPDDYLAKMSEISGVPLEWIKYRRGAMIDERDTDFGAVVKSRLNRAEARDAANLGVAETSGADRYLLPLDGTLGDRPLSHAARGGPISTELLAKVCEAVERWGLANKGRVRISPERKATLIAVAYARFEGKTFEEREMAHILKLVA